MQRRRRRQTAAVGCLEAENAIGYFKSAGLQAAAAEAGAALSNTSNVMGQRHPTKVAYYISHKPRWANPEMKVFATTKVENLSE